MANEIQISVSLGVSKGGASDNRAEEFKVTMTGNSMTHSVQGIPISTGEVLVEADELDTPGWVFIKNLDSTNYITVGAHATANHIVRVNAGETCVFRAATNIYAMANTAACLVEYIIVED